MIGCDWTSSSEESPNPPTEGDGAVSFSLKRTANSDVPSDADSAFVRVWTSDGDFNLTELVNIPDPGQQTEVSLDVSAGTGYRAGVLAVTPGLYPTDKIIRAHGSSGQFTVESNDTSQVNLDVRPAELTLERPESLAPNQTDTITATYQINPPDVSPSLIARQGSDPAFNVGDGTSLSSVGAGTEADTSISEQYEITAPNVENEDTTYVKVRVNPGSTSSWTTIDRSTAPSWFPSRDGPSFEIPVVPEGGDDGTVIITFSKGEDGWEKTRRIVE